MTKQKSTKRMLLSSVLSLMLCISMLIGTTFAWFTDTAASKNNKIVAGNLDVELLMYKETADGKGEYVDISKDSAPIFGNADSEKAQNDNADTLWEPGKTQVAYLAIRNAGNLALKYQVSLNVKNPEDGKNLHEVMQYTITRDAEYGDATPWDDTNAKTPVLGSQIVSDGEGQLQKEETHYFALSVHMMEEAGNKYQGGQIDFDLTVLATQLNAESDSFGSDYDKEATYYEAWDGTVDTELDEVDGVYQITSPAELAGFAQLVNSGDTTMMNADVVLTTSINLAGKEFTPIGNCDSGKYFQGTFDGDGHTIYNLTINNTDTGKNATTGLFGWTDAAASTISNLTVEGAEIVGHHWVGVIAGYHTGVIENCKVVNATVNGTHANDEADGDKVGGIVGCLNSKSKLINNTVADSTISGNRDIGGIAGSVATGATMTGNVVKNTTVTYVTAKSSYESAGAIVSGRTGFVPDSTNKAENVTVLKAANTTASFKAAIENAQAGDTITLATDVDYGNTQLELNKEITIDLNGNELTTANNWGGTTIKNGASIKNGTINHTGNTAAVKVAGEIGSIENVTINVTPTEGKTKTGIQVYNGKYVESIKNVTITGATQGIEVAKGSRVDLIENVKVKAVPDGDKKGVALLVNAASVGKAVNCTFEGDYGVHMMLNGEFEVALELDNCTVIGSTAALIAHDEAGISNTTNCSLELTYDAETVFNGEFIWNFEEECQSVVTLNAPAN